MIRAQPLVLASASPRRRELLARLGLEFSLRPVDTDEASQPGEAPRDLVERLALAKARAAVRPGETALGADTVVALDRQTLGKPIDDDDACRMLRSLSGRDHEVWSGVALVALPANGSTPTELVRACRTRVRFRALDEEEIRAYVASGEPADKAGAYAIQGGASEFIEELEGEITNVIGLPLPVVVELLGLLEV